MKKKSDIEGVATKHEYQPCLHCESLAFKARYYIKRHERNIAQCSQCGLLQVNPRQKMLNFVDHEDTEDREKKLDTLFDVMLKDTDPALKSVMEKENAVKERQFLRKLNKIRQYCKKGTLLDVGSAQGVFLSLCSTFETYGVEPSKYTCEESKLIAPNSTIYNCTLVEAGIPDSSFDVVTLINTLEHLLHPEKTLVEIHRILKPGGFLMIETPNAGHLIPRVLGRWWFQFLIPDHVVFYSKNQLSDILENIGFGVKEIGYPFKTVSLKLLLFHANRYIKPVSKYLSFILEKIGASHKTISFPQYDEMVVLAKKRGVEEKFFTGASMK